MFGPPGTVEMSDPPGTIEMSGPPGTVEATEHRRDTQRGAGMIGTSTGFLVFLLLMFAAVQVLFNLYATSMVTTAAYDAARSVAYFGSPADRCAAVPAAEAAMTDSLGDYAAAGHVTTSWICNDPDSVSVRVVADHPTILPPRMAGLLSLGRLDRTISVRVEEFR